MEGEKEQILDAELHYIHAQVLQTTVYQAISFSTKHNSIIQYKEKV